jgi:hypothetical protein
MAAAASPLAPAATQRVLYLDEAYGADWLLWLCDTYRFRAVGMRAIGGGAAEEDEGGDEEEQAAAPSRPKRPSTAQPPARRAWVLVRPGIARPLAVRAAPHHLVFDLNGVLAAKLLVPPPRPAPWAHVRLPPPSPLVFLLRPGAAKLLRMLAAEGHWVWLWSTMQPASVAALAAALAPFLARHRCLAAPDCAPGGVKDLRTLWRRAEGERREVFAHEPQAQGAAALPRPEHTLLFDDDPAKCHPDHAAHFVRVAPFAPDSPWDYAAAEDREMLRLLAFIAARIHPPATDAEVSESWP